LIARVYEQLDSRNLEFPESLSDLRLADSSIEEWLKASSEFIDALSNRGCLFIAFSPLLRSIAADLESKLAESALLHCQLSDIRSFAHGRHLWAAKRVDDFALIGLVDPTLQNLWSATCNLLPDDLPIATMPFRGSKPPDLVAGLIAQMKLVSEIAASRSEDPGRPVVPDFGKQLHYLDLRELIQPADNNVDRGEESKRKVLGASWPSFRGNASITRARRRFESTLSGRSFSAVVFDYDGTLCSSNAKKEPPKKEVADALIKLASCDIEVGIATGRGGSVRKDLRECIPQEYWDRFHLGLYNCGAIARLGDEPENSPETSEYINHVSRIAHQLEAIGVPIELIKPSHPHQVSIRFQRGTDTERIWFVVADALRKAGLDPSRAVRSKHSIDVLPQNVDKNRLVEHMVLTLGIAPFEILTMGDQGAWPGNDSSLLEHKFSLSVDEPSRHLDRGWKLAPTSERDVDATLWYLERAQYTEDGKFSLNLNENLPS
jgi:HAD superfamily hydrolase (TIGR01484 family)